MASCGGCVRRKVSSCYPPGQQCSSRSSQAQRAASSWRSSTCGTSAPRRSETGCSQRPTSTRLAWDRPSWPRVPLRESGGRPRLRRVARRCLQGAERGPALPGRSRGTERPCHAALRRHVACQRHGYASGRRTARILADYSDWPPKEEAAKALPHADAAYVLFNDRARIEIESYGSLLQRPRRS